MTTRIRLRRMGANKRPFYRVVVADQRSPRNGRFIENIGRYHPLEDPSLIEIDEERALHWLRVGAQPSDQVRNLMDKIGIWGKFTTERPSAVIAPKPGKADKPVKPKVSKKAAQKAATQAAEAKAPVARAAPDEAPEAPEAAPEVRRVEALEEIPVETVQEPEAHTEAGPEAGSETPETPAGEE